MKLLFCKNCSSVFNIDSHNKECKCGKTKGRYIDNVNAIYCGKYALPMGMDNNDLISYLGGEKERDISMAMISNKPIDTRYIGVWFITKNDCCSTFLKLTIKDYEKRE